MNNFGKYLHIFYPVSFGLLSLIFFIFIGKGYEIKGISDVLGSVINFSSIIIGFYTAMYGVLLTLKDSDIMKKFRENDLNSLFKTQLYESLVVSFGVLLLSIALQVVINYDTLLTLILFYIWTFFLGYFVAISFRTISLLVSIMFNNEQINRNTTNEDISEENREEMVDDLKESDTE